MPIKIGNITLLDWMKKETITVFRPIDDEDDYGSGIYIFKVVDKYQNKEYAPNFMGKLEFLEKYYEMVYGIRPCKTLQQAKDQVDNILIKFDKLKAFV